MTGHGADAVEAAVGRSSRDDAPGAAAGDRRRRPHRPRGRSPAETASVLVAMGDAPLLPPRCSRAARRRAQAAGGRLHRARLRPRSTTRRLRPHRARADGAVRGDRRGGRTPTRRPCALGEINAGTYAFDAGWLRANIGRVPARASGEQYLTDLVAMAASYGRPGGRRQRDDAAELRWASTTGRAGGRRADRMRGGSPRRTCATGSPSSTRETRIDAGVEIGAGRAHRALDGPRGIDRHRRRTP